jgi:L-fucose mutarotase
VLKGIDPILGPELLMTLRAMGHGDEIAIVDANYPADTDARRLVRMGGLDAPRLVDAILSLMPLDNFVEQAVFRPGINDDAEHCEPIMLEFERIVFKYNPKVRIVPLPGETFYGRVRNAYAVVASGERRLYGNLILRKGIIGPDPV